MAPTPGKRSTSTTQPPPVLCSAGAPPPLPGPPNHRIPSLAYASQSHEPCLALHLDPATPSLIPAARAGAAPGPLLYRGLAHPRIPCHRCGSSLASPRETTSGYCGGSRRCRLRGTCSRHSPSSFTRGSPPSPVSAGSPSCVLNRRRIRL